MVGRVGGAVGSPSAGPPGAKAVRRTGGSEHLGSSLSPVSHMV